jgi:hypothetical protein
LNGLAGGAGAAAGPLHPAADRPLSRHPADPTPPPGAWFTQRHQALNVKYIIWWGEIIDYRDVSPAWGPCKKPVSSCATLHFDHVHVSFTA